MAFRKEPFLEAIRATHGNHKRQKIAVDLGHDKTALIETGQV